MSFPNHTEGTPSLLGTGDIDTMQAQTSIRVPDTPMTVSLACVLSASSADKSISTGKERDAESGNDYFPARGERALVLKRSICIINRLPGAQWFIEDKLRARASSTSFNAWLNLPSLPSAFRVRNRLKRYQIINTHLPPGGCTSSNHPIRKVRFANNYLAFNALTGLKPETGDTLPFRDAGFQPFWG